MKERAKPGRIRLFVWGKRALRCCDAAAGEYIFHHPLPRMVPLLLRKMERKPDWLSDFPVQIYCNRRRKRINATGMNANLEGLSSVSLRLTAPSAEGAFWREPEQSLP